MSGPTHRPQSMAIKTRIDDGQSPARDRGATINASPRPISTYRTPRGPSPTNKMALPFNPAGKGLPPPPPPKIKPQDATKDPIQNSTSTEDLTVHPEHSIRSENSTLQTDPETQVSIPLAPTISSNDLTTCSRCDTEVATIVCHQCAESLFCNSCALDIHAKGKWKTHEYVALYSEMDQAVEDLDAIIGQSESTTDLSEPSNETPEPALEPLEQSQTPTTANTLEEETTEPSHPVQSEPSKPSSESSEAIAIQSQSTRPSSPSPKQSPPMSVSPTGAWGSYVPIKRSPSIESTILGRARSMKIDPNQTRALKGAIESGDGRQLDSFEPQRAPNQPSKSDHPIQDAAPAQDITPIENVQPISDQTTESPPIADPQPELSDPTQDRISSPPTEDAPLRKATISHSHEPLDLPDISSISHSTSDDAHQESSLTPSSDPVTTVDSEANTDPVTIVDPVQPVDSMTTVDPVTAVDPVAVDPVEDEVVTPPPEEPILIGAPVVPNLKLTSSNGSEESKEQVKMVESPKQSKPCATPRTQLQVMIAGLNEAALASKSTSRPLSPPPMGSPRVSRPVNKGPFEENANSRVQKSASHNSPQRSTAIPGKITPLSPRERSASPQDRPQSMAVGKVSALRNQLGANIVVGALKPTAPGFVATAGNVQTRKQHDIAVEEEIKKKTIARLIPIVVSIPDKDVQTEKIFPPHTSVKLILQWAMKFMLNESYPEKKVVNQMYYHLFYNGKQLDMNCTLYSLHPQPKDVFEMKLVKHEAYFAKANLPGNTSVTLKVDETTTVWFLLQTLLKKVHNRQADWALPVPPDAYGLFLSGTELDTDAFLNDYKNMLKEPISLTNKSALMPDIDAHLSVLYGADSVAFGCNKTMTVSQVLKKFIVCHVLKTSQPLTTADYFFEIPPNDDDLETAGEIMLREEPISKYLRDELLLVEFKFHGKQYQIESPEGDILPVSVDSMAIASELLDMMTANANLSSPTSEYVLTYDDGEVLSSERTIWSYNLPLDTVFRVQKAPHPLVVFLEDGSSQRTLNVDYSTPVHKILANIWKAFSIPAKKEGEFNLQRLSPNVPLDLKKSLNNQGVPQSSTVIIKSIAGLTPEPAPIPASTVVTPKATEESIAMMYDGEGKIRAGSLANLIAALYTGSADHDYMKAFMMTFHSFTTPDVVLSKLIEAYDRDEPNTRGEEKKIKQFKIVNAIKHWLDAHWEDFDHDLINQVVAFADVLDVQKPGDRTTALLRQGIIKRNCGMRTKENFRGRTTTKMLLNCPDIIVKTTQRRKQIEGIPLNVFDFDELEIARQITLIEFEYYRKIMPTELLDQNWTKRPHKSPNVINFISRSTQVSLWVATLIIEPPRVKLRAQRFAFLIRVAEHLRNMNNYSGLMSFLGGFNNAAVIRMRFTRQLLPKRALEVQVELENVMSTESSSKNYRSALALSELPCIPYLGTSLGDLTFMDEGNPNMINDMINMGKRSMTYRVISQIGSYQMMPYILHHNEALQKQIRDLPIQEAKYGDQLYNLSLGREPRGAEKVS
eukprot:TRINITY_DN2100_c0_g1_i2.p1 TRINITY_DN2100_c0_g1~~TRINITY_DN2100_c0_g1_i2.p1  ORF type:complete len:1527 (-),score=404.68 TRINITY_DN2100_c0_g1_i2:155-4735(-)